MATRSYIGEKFSDGSIRGIYCHWDGYPQHVGAVLLKHYSDPDKVSALINEGDMSNLRADIGEKHVFDYWQIADTDLRDIEEAKSERWCSFYGRDRGEEGVDAACHKTVKIFVAAGNNLGAEFFYLFDRTKNQWFYSVSGTRFVKLTPKICKINKENVNGTTAN